MGFFEFFFSNPGWGWRLFGLLLLISTVGDIVCKLFTTYIDYRDNKYKRAIELLLNDGDLDDNDIENTEDNGNNPATIDDCR